MITASILAMTVRSRVNMRYPNEIAHRGDLMGPVERPWFGLRAKAGVADREDLTDASARFRSLQLHHFHKFRSRVKFTQEVKISLAFY